MLAKSQGKNISSFSTLVRSLKYHYLVYRSRNASAQEALQFGTKNLRIVNTRRFETQDTLIVAVPMLSNKKTGNGRGPGNVDGLGGYECTCGSLSVARIRGIVRG